MAIYNQLASDVKFNFMIVAEAIEVDENSEAIGVDGKLIYYYEYSSIKNTITIQSLTIIPNCAGDVSGIRFINAN